MTAVGREEVHARRCGRPGRPPRGTGPRGAPSPRRPAGAPRSLQGAHHAAQTFTTTRRAAQLVRAARGTDRRSSTAGRSRLSGRPGAAVALTAGVAGPVPGDAPPPLSVHAVRMTDTNRHPIRSQKPGQETGRETRGRERRRHPRMVERLADEEPSDAADARHPDRRDRSEAGCTAAPAGRTKGPEAHVVLAEAFDIDTVGGLLHHYPRRYIDRSRVQTIARPEDRRVRAR